jgi:hypothetical protein
LARNAQVSLSNADAWFGTPIADSTGNQFIDFEFDCFQAIAFLNNAQCKYGLVEANSIATITNYQPTRSDWLDTIQNTAGSTSPGVVWPYIYSAATTPVPACGSSNKGALAMVSDATAPTYNGAYTSGGAVTVTLLCNGTSWVTH